MLMQRMLLDCYVLCLCGCPEVLDGLENPCACSRSLDDVENHGTSPQAERIEMIIVQNKFRHVNI